MVIELEKEDLVNLVKGSNPHYNVMNDSLIKQCGSFIGGHHDRWEWDNSSLEKLTESQLWQMYSVCRDSWK